MDKTWRERTILQVGEEGAERLARSRVAVIGLGGVGSFAAEMIVRAGVGEIIIADSDVYSITNKNRQLGAVDSTIGKKKTDVMRERLVDINKELKITAIDEYLTEENIKSVLPFWMKVMKLMGITMNIQVIRLCTIVT